MTQLWAVKHGSDIWYSELKHALTAVVITHPGTFIEPAAWEVLELLIEDGFKLRPISEWLKYIRSLD